MAILLPYGLEYNRHKNGHLTAELLLPLTGVDVYAKTPRDGRIDEVIARVRQLNQDLHEASGGRHPRFFKEVADRNGNPMVPRERLTEIARTALSDGTVFYNPEELDYDDFLMVLEAAWEGRPLDTSRIKKG
jgi:alcohol dehydrogenase